MTIFLLKMTLNRLSILDFDILTWSFFIQWPVHDFILVYTRQLAEENDCASRDFVVYGLKEQL